MTCQALCQAVCLIRIQRGATESIREEKKYGTVVMYEDL